MKKFKTIQYKVTVILFIVMLLAPNIIQIFDLEKNVVHNENRKYKTLPEFKLSKPLHSIGQFKNYYLENYGTKTILVNSYIEFKSEKLNENPIPNRVLQGKNGWLFIGNHYNNVLNNSFGNDNFTEKELSKTLDFFKKTKAYLDSKNISLYLVVPPDKNRIYQEFLPYTLKQHKTKLDVLNTELKKKVNIDIINLYKPLLANKNMQSQSLYLKTDTHWNYYGAYVGYSTVMDKINKQQIIPRIAIDSFNIIETKIDPLDLSKMINLKEKEKAYVINKKNKNNVKVLFSGKEKLHVKNEEKSLKVILYRDSFTNAMIPFFNETFNEIIYNKSYSIDKKEIESFKPDIVIIEIIERNIDMFATIKPFKK